MNDIIINSVNSHLDILKSIFYGILVFSLVSGWSVFRGNENIQIAGIKIKTESAYEYLIWAYVIINLIVLMLLFRLNEFLVNFNLKPTNNKDFQQIILAIKSYPWVLNPFSDFSYLPPTLLDSQSTLWVKLDTIVNYIVSGFGCFSLLLIWRCAHIVLAFTKERAKIFSTSFAEYLLIVLLLLLVFLIFLILCNMGSEIMPPAIGAILGFIAGTYYFGMSLFHFKNRQQNHHCPIKQSNKFKWL